MALPSAWIEELFGRLSVRYGQAFQAMYRDLDIAVVKADWADVLDGFQERPATIKHALANLPSDKPPNAQQFRALCMQTPIPAAPALAAPATKADPERVAQAMQSASNKPQGFDYAKSCADALRARRERGKGKLGLAQQHQLAALEAIGK